MKTQLSLRTRIILFLAVPIVLLVAFLTYESYNYSKKIAQSSFDNSLVILALAIFNNSDNYNADHLSEDLLDIITDTISDVFYYHVKIDEGSYISGYSGPPVIDKPLDEIPTGKPYLFDGQYRDIPVRAVLYRVYGDGEPVDGWIEILVWQSFNRQNEIHTSLFIRSLMRMGAQTLLIFPILWFGVRWGLKPLNKLGKAVKRRNYSDLSKIERDVPKEAIPLVDSMNELFLRIRQSIARRDSFLSNASHQLKTPLANIRAQAELAAMSDDPNKIEEHVSGIVNISDQSAHMVEQMLSLLKAESREVLFANVKKTELSELIREACESFAHKAFSEKRELELEDMTDGVTINADAIMLSECLINLIDNAFHYSRPHKPIRVILSREGNFATIKINDFGPGIPTKQQDNALRRFTRLDNSTKNGCGLGLAIANQVIETHKGSLQFRYESDLTFSTVVKIPIYKEATESVNNVSDA